MKSQKTNNINQHDLPRYKKKIKIKLIEKNPLNGATILSNQSEKDYMPVENILPSQEEQLNKIIIDSIRDLQPPRYWTKDDILKYTHDYGVRIMNACYEHEWIVQVPLRPDNPDDYTLIENEDHSLTFIWSPQVNILGMRKHSQNEAYDFEKHQYEIRKKEGTVDAAGHRIA